MDGSRTFRGVLATTRIMPRLAREGTVADPPPHDTKRQRYTHDQDQAIDHSDVDDHLPDDPGDDAVGEGAGERPFGPGDGLEKSVTAVTARGASTMRVPARPSSSPRKVKMK